MADTPSSFGAALARLYDLDLVEDPGDLDLYLALATRTGGPILELARGTGRLAVPLAAAGHDVTGGRHRSRRCSSVPADGQTRQARQRAIESSSSRPTCSAWSFASAGTFRLALVGAELALPPRHAGRPARGVRDHGPTSRTRRPCGRRRLAARCGRSRPIRRPADPRVRAARIRSPAPSSRRSRPPSTTRRAASST